MSEQQAATTIADWLRIYSAGQSLVLIDRLREVLDDDAQVAAVLAVLDTTCQACWNTDTRARVCWCSADD